MSSFWRENWSHLSTCPKLAGTAAKANFYVYLAGMLCSILLTMPSVGGGVSKEISPNSYGLQEEPRFVEEISNITVTSGREAILSCVVDNLGAYRVGWLKVDTQTILSLQKRVVTHNSRISVTHDEHRTWNLHIKQVRESDRGCYMCQLNTPNMMMTVGCIEVYVPPNIIDEKTSSETTVNELDTVVLRCSAVGYPTPTVQWQREDMKDIRLAMSGREYMMMEKVEGENLTLKAVTRKQMGAYFCIARNGVPPIVSKRIQLNVNFAPIVKVDNQLIGSPMGKKVEIVCSVQAYPLAINYWQKDNNEMILKSRKYNLSEETQSYKTTLNLLIRNFTKADEGQYKCMSTNSLGKSETTIRLYVITVSVPKSTTEQLHPSLLSTSSPANGVSSLDHRKRQDRKRLGKGPYEPFGSTDDRDASGRGESSSQRQHEKHRLNFDFEDRPGGSGIGNGIFDSGDGMSGAPAFGFLSWWIVSGGFLLCFVQC